MKILLIEPPFHRFMGFKCDWFPIGLGYLASVLEKEGHQVAIYSAEKHIDQQYLRSSELLRNFDRYAEALRDKEHPVWKEVTDVIKSYRPEVLGITVMTVKLASALRLAQIAKSLNQMTTVVAGGPHASLLPKELLDSGNVDAVVRGEGEETFQEIVQALEKGRRELRGVDGVSFWMNGEVRHNKARERIKDLGALPFPARHLLINRDLYEPEDFGNLITSRGCPYRCGFCSSPQIWTKRVRFRPAEDIIEEIKQIKATYGTSHFFFWDDVFTISKRRVRELCQGIKKEKLMIKWECITRANLIDDEVLKIMKRSGCTAVEIGVESGDQTILDYMQKDVTLEQIRSAAALLRKNKLFWSAFFMFGLNVETRESINRTMNFVKEIKPDWCTFSIFTPMPEVELTRKLVERELMPTNPDWSLFCHQSPHNYFVEGISKEDFQQMMEKAAIFFERYNRRPVALMKKAWARSYHRNPRLLYRDLKKFINWIR